MLFMVIEKFINNDPRPIYQRLDESGRMMPAELTYVNSWISEDLSTCWQVMETESPEKFADWIRHWDDLVQFEIVPVMTSAEARAKTDRS